MQRCLEEGQFDYILYLEDKLLGDYNQLLKYKESFWQKKSRVSWLKEGERSAWYFYQTAISRRHRSIIMRLKDSTREWLGNEERLGILAREFYYSLYRAESTAPLDDICYFLVSTKGTTEDSTG